MREFVLTGLVLAAASSMLLAGILPDAAAHEEEQRYSLEKTAEGYVRLDTRTGEMSICSEASGQLVCRMAADERTAFEDEIDRVTARLQDVEKRLTALEGNPPATPSAGLPSEQDFEKTLSYMERFFRRFIGIVKDLDQELRKDESEPAQPQRT